MFSNVYKSTSSAIIPKEQSIHKMYGLLLENLSEYVKTVFGDEKWEEIRRQAGISAPSFGVHDDYDEDLLNHLATTAQQVSFINFFFHLYNKKDAEQRTKKN